MARTLVSSSPFIDSGLPSLISHRGRKTISPRRFAATRVRVSLNEIPPIHSFDSSVDFQAIFSKAKSLLYTLADAAVAVDSAAMDASPQKSGGWFGFISDSMEFVLKVRSYIIILRSTHIAVLCSLMCASLASGAERWACGSARSLCIWFCDYTPYSYC